jgi:hypothetical protein
MSQSYEPHRLVIQHLAVLEAASVIVDEVDKQVFASIDETIKDWVASRDGWEGQFDYLELGTLFKPKSWENNEKGEYQAYYSLDPEEGKSCKYKLVPLIAATSVRYGIWFSVDTTWVTRLVGKGVRHGPAWKSFLAGQFPTSRLAGYGFELQGGDLFMPIRVDAQVLAEDYPDSKGDALAPIREALQKLEAAHPEIDALLKAALAYQFGKAILPAGEA